MNDILLHNALILTLEPGAAPIPCGYLAVQGSRISAVGSIGAAPALPPARQNLDL